MASRNSHGKGPHGLGLSCPECARHRRPKTSPPAPEAREKQQLSDRLRAKQASSRSPPEKGAPKRRLSLGAPQRQGPSRLQSGLPYQTRCWLCPLTEALSSALTMLRMQF